MRAFIVIIIVGIQLNICECGNGGTAFSLEDEKKFLKEIGCGENGTLVDLGVCTTYGYQSHIAPRIEEGGLPKALVFTTIYYQKIRDIDDKKGNTIIEIL